jgi:hypothetical protein
MAQIRLGETVWGLIIWSGSSRRRRGWPAVAAHRNWPYKALQTSVFDEIFTYGIEATWLTYFAQLGMTVGNDGDWCWWGGLAQAQRRCRRSPGLL